MELLPKSTRKFLSVVRADTEMENWVNAGMRPPKGSNYKIPYFWWDGPAQFGCAANRPAAEALLSYAAEIDPDYTGFFLSEYTASRMQVKKWHETGYDGLRFPPFYLDSEYLQDPQMNLMSVILFLETEENKSVIC